MGNLNSELTIPSVDSTANVTLNDVVGNKSDTHDGTSIMAFRYTMLDHVHSRSKVYPMMKVGVTITSSATAYTLGAATTIVGTIQNLDNSITSNPSGTVTRFALTGHTYVVGDYVTLVGVEAGQLGTWQISAVSDANHFDVDTGTYTEQTPPGDANETSQDVIPRDFDIHHLSIENLSANAIYEIVLYDDGVECGRVRVTKNAAQDGTTNIPIQTPIMASGSVITAKASTENAADDAAILTIFYHTY